MTPPVSRSRADTWRKRVATLLIVASIRPAPASSGPPADEREQAARDVLAEVRFIRYAPQLGDYSEKIREVADRAAAVVRRWA
jgi:hypothetical protein